MIEVPELSAGFAGVYQCEHGRHWWTGTKCDCEARIKREEDGRQKVRAVINQHLAELRGSLVAFEREEKGGGIRLPATIRDVCEALVDCHKSPSPRLISFLADRIANLND